MMNQQSIKTEIRRLMILQILEAGGNYRENEGLIQKSLELYGLTASRDVIRADLAWLADLELITVEESLGCQMAALRFNGVDVVKGRLVVPGISRPVPE